MLVVGSVVVTGGAFQTSLVVAKDVTTVTVVGIHFVVVPEYIV